MAGTKFYPLLGLLLFAAAIFLPAHSSINSKLYLLSLSIVLSGWQIFRTACINFINRRVDPSVLITLAIIGLLSQSMLIEAAVYICLLGVLHFIQNILAEKLINEKLDIWPKLPDEVMKLEDEQTKKMPTEQINVDDLIILGSGEMLAADAIIEEGDGKIKPSLVGLDILPETVQENNLLFASATNLEQPLKLRVIANKNDSLFNTATKTILEAIKRKKFIEIQKYSQNWSRRLLVFILFMALPFFFLGQPMLTWLQYSLTILLIFAPYNAIIESSGVLIARALDKAARLGIIVLDQHSFEQAAEIEAIAFAKDTTLTSGLLIMSNIYAPYPFNRNEVLLAAATLTKAANHPLAQSILQQAQGLDLPDTLTVQLIEHNEANNIQAWVEGKELLFGSNSFLEAKGIKTCSLLRKYAEYLAHGSTVLFVAIDGQAAGVISFIEDLRPQVFATIGKIRSLGIPNIIMLTKEQEKAALSASRPLGFTKAVSNLSDNSKAPVVQKLHFEYGSILIVGDAKKDSALMKNADISIAINVEKDLNAATKNADIVMLGDYFYSLPQLFALSKSVSKTLGAYKKIILIGKIAFIILALLNYLYLWQIIFLDGLIGILFILYCIKFPQEHAANI